MLHLLVTSTVVEVASSFTVALPTVTVVVFILSFIVKVPAFNTAGFSRSS
jgi:hypothetical protein